MFACPSVRPLTCLPVRPSVHPFNVCLSVRSSIRSHVCLSISPSIRLHVGLSVRLFIRSHVCLSVRPSVRPSAYMFACPSVCPFLCTSVQLLITMSLLYSFVHPSLLSFCSSVIASTSRPFVHEYIRPPARYVIRSHYTSTLVSSVSISILYHSLPLFTIPPIPQIRRPCASSVVGRYVRPSQSISPFIHPSVHPSRYTLHPSVHRSDEAVRQSVIFR